MDILIDARTIGAKPSGIGMYAYGFARALLMISGVKVILVTDVAESEYILELKSLGACVEEHRVCNNKWNLLRYQRYLIRMIRKHNPDIFWEPNIILPIGISSHRWNKNRNGIKNVITIHDMVTESMPQCYGKIYQLYIRYGLRYSCRRTDLIIYNSKETKRETEKYFPQTKKIRSYVSYIICGQGGAEPKSKECAIDEAITDGGERASSEAMTDARRCASSEAMTNVRRCASSEAMTNVRLCALRGDYYLYIGNMEWRKGVDILLNAYEQYNCRGGKCKLILAGKVTDDSIGKLLERATKGNANIKYIEYVTEEDKVSLYKNCKAFVFPSRLEGFGIPVVEAILYNKTVIIGDNTIYDEILYENCPVRSECVRTSDYVNAQHIVRVAELYNESQSSRNSKNLEKNDSLKTASNNLVNVLMRLDDNSRDTATVRLDNNSRDTTTVRIDDNNMDNSYSEEYIEILKDRYSESRLGEALYREFEDIKRGKIASH